MPGFLDQRLWPFPMEFPTRRGSIVVFKTRFVPFNDNGRGRRSIRRTGSTAGVFTGQGGHKAVMGRLRISFYGRDFRRTFIRSFPVRVTTGEVVPTTRQ